MSFKATNYLLFEDRKPEVDIELLEEFSPYMTNKTLSFYMDGMLAGFVNDTLNLYGNILPTNEEQFKFYQNIIPKLPKKKINYIKKQKKEKNTERQPIPEFSSKREIDIKNNLLKYLHE